MSDLKKENKELVTKEQEQSPYAVALNTSAEFKEIMREAVGSSGLTMFDLQKISVPAGGGQTWEIETIDGQEAKKEIQGIIIFQQDARKYYVKSYGEETGNPPDCASNDGFVGVGNPGGDCLKCLFAEYGSDLKDKNGKRQACGAYKNMFVLLPGNVLPININIPTGSIKNAKAYLLRLASGGKRPYDVITNFTLEKAHSTDNIQFSRVKFAVVGKLSDEEKTKIKEYAENFKKMLNPVSGS